MQAGTHTHTHTDPIICSTQCRSFNPDRSLPHNDDTKTPSPLLQLIIYLFISLRTLRNTDCLCVAVCSIRTGREEDWQAGEQRDRQMCRQTDARWSGFRMRQSVQSYLAVRIKFGKVNGACFTLCSWLLKMKNMHASVCIHIYGCGYTCVSEIVCMQTATQQTDSGNQATDSLLNLLKPQIVLSLF